MSFAHPWVLLLLATPILIGLWEIWRRGHEVPMPFDHSGQGHGRWTRRLLFAANLLPVLLLAGVILILAGPRRPGKPGKERLLTNIEFCLDVSGSMTSDFQEGSQYDAAMAAINEFTSRRKGDAFGLTIFGNEVLRWVPLTQDLSAIRMATPFLRPEKLPGHFGGTEIGKGVRFCMDTLTRQKEGDRLIILLTDGRSADLYGDTAYALGNRLRQEEITVYAIYIGEGEAPEELYAIAHATEGRVFPVSDPTALKAVFRHIDQMEPARLKPSATYPVDNFALFAWVCLGLMGVYLVTLFGLRYTPW